MKAIEVVLLILFGIWVIGTVVITSRHSEETLWSLLKLQVPQTTLIGWVYLILWGIMMFGIIGLVGYLSGYHYH